MKPNRIILLLLAASLCACSADSGRGQADAAPAVKAQAQTDSAAPMENAMDSNASEATAEAVVAKSPTRSSTELQAAFKKDMAYADLRKLVLDGGWTPVVEPACKKNVGGEAEICDQIPELDACSGDGYCIMHFESVSSGEKLDVTTYGMVEDWNVAGEDSRLNVTEWGFAKASKG